VVAKRLLAALGGSVVCAVAGACAVHQIGAMGERDVETPITIRRAVAEPKKCIVTSKEADVRVHKDKWLEVKFSNYCDDEVTAAVGNFRTSENPPGVPADCANPYFGGPTPIFRETDPNDFKTRIGAGSSSHPKSEKIKLKVRTRGELGEKELVYYFDVCIDGTKQTDPRLIIEP